MDLPDFDLLNRRFGAPGRIAFRPGPGGLPVAALACRTGACEVSLYGAHVLSYRPVGHAPALFLSRHSLFEPGKPIRGGIPVCWPWFGPHPDGPALPLHGFARLLQWGLRTTEYSADATELTLALEDSDLTRRYAPHAFGLLLRVRLDQRLSLELTTENRGPQPLSLTQAFHPYLLVRDIADVTVHGLDQAPYTDRLTRLPAVQQGAFTVGAETDRLYRPPAPECLLHDAGLRRALALTFSGTDRLVVWNPWIDKARAMPDFGDDEYARMLCLEPANAAEAAVTLAPGATHTLGLALQASLT